MAVTAGQFQGNSQAATDYLKSFGGDPSSGAVNYAAFGNTGYSQGDAERYGLPMTSNIIQGQRTAAIAPAVNSLTASRPEISSTFDTRATQLGAEKQPLVDRYQSLLDQLKGRETKDTAAQGRTLSNEYGKRGIPLSSGVYEQDLTAKNQDINQYYAGQNKDVTLGRESDLRDLDNQITNLAQQKVTALRDVDNKIAELQAGAGNAGVTDALQNYRDTLDKQFTSRFDELDKKVKEAAIAKSNAADSPYLSVPEGNAVVDTRTFQQRFLNPKTYKATGGGEGDGGW